MIESKTIMLQKDPRCPACGRQCEHGITWPRVNYCRGLILLEHIGVTPGLSAWELSQLSGMDYSEATKGLAKLRERGIVTVKSEERAAGGVRYRYYPADDPVARAHFVEFVRRMEALQ